MNCLGALYTRLTAQLFSLFTAYGPASGVVNHSKKLANVRYQWSSHPMHRADLLDMSYRQFWENVYPGALILELVALRDLHPGEELFMDYGDAVCECGQYSIFFFVKS